MLADLNINNFEDMLNYVPNSKLAQSGSLSSDPNGSESIFGVRYRLNVDNLLDGGETNVMLSRQVYGQRSDSRWALTPGQSFAFSANFEL